MKTNAGPAVPEKDFQATMVTIPGTPVPWAVFTRNSKPSPGFLAMQEWQAKIRVAARAVWQGRPEIEGPVELSFCFVLPWPASAPRINGPAASRWAAKHIKMKPDLTNLEKAAEDALKREAIKRDGRLIGYQPVILVDDNQVIQKGYSQKVFNSAPDGLTVVWIKELRPSDMDMIERILRGE